MCQPKKWWWGLLPLAALWVLANWQKAGPIAADLEAKARASIAAAGPSVPGLAPVAVAVAGRDVAVSGEVLRTDAQAQLLQSVDSEFGVRRADGALRAAQPVRPYAWSATRDGSRVTLTGLVPDNTTKSANVAAAARAFPGAQVVDEQRIAFGAPAGFTAAASAGIAELGKLSSGKVTLNDQNFCFEGVAATPASFLDVVRQVANAPQGFTRQACSVTPPVQSPFTWSAAKAASGAITLTGFYPSDAVRAEINAAVRSANPGAQVTDEMQPAAGAPAGLVAAATAGAGLLPRLGEGAASISNTLFSLVGRGVGDNAACVAFRGGLASALPQGFSPGTLAVQCPDPPPPPPVPLAFRAEKSAAGIVLSGLVPSAEARAAVVEAARRATTGAVTDNLTITPNLAAAPPYGAATAYALERLGSLTSGEASLAARRCRSSARLRRPRRRPPPTPRSERCRPA